MSATPAEGSQVESTPAPQAGTPTTPGTDLPQAGTHDDLNPAQLRAELDRARKEAAKYRTDLRKFETAAEAKAAAELSEVERLRQELSAKDEAITQAQQRERRYALREAVETAVSTERLELTAPLGDVLRLLDADAIEWDEAGAPQNVPALVKALVAARPYLLGRRASVDGGAGGETRLPGTRMTDLILSRSKR